MRIIFALCFVGMTLALSPLCDEEWFDDDVAFRDNGQWVPSSPYFPLNPNEIKVQTPFGGRPFFRFDTTFTAEDFEIIATDQGPEFAVELPSWAGGAFGSGAFTGRIVDCGSQDPEDCPQRAIYTPLIFAYPVIYEKSCMAFCRKDISSTEVQYAFRSIDQSECPDEGFESTYYVRNATYAMFIKELGNGDVDMTWIGQEDPLSPVHGGPYLPAATIAGYCPGIFTNRLNGRKALYD